jgi:hypothetical protein
VLLACGEILLRTVDVTSGERQSGANNGYLSRVDIGRYSGQGLRHFGPGGRWHEKSPDHHSTDNQLRCANPVAGGHRVIDGLGHTSRSRKPAGRASMKLGNVGRSLER